MNLLKRCLATLILCGGASAAMAVEPGEILDDPTKEVRARELSQQIRCLVCQNQSIDESNAPLARDMRVLIRERIKAGKTNQEIKAYLTDRYGDFVLLKPPMKPETYVLWYGPAVIVLLGAVGVAVFYIRGRQGTSRSGPGLSDAEARRVRDLMNEEDTTS